MEFGKLLFVCLNGIGCIVLLVLVLLIVNVFGYCFGVVIVGIVIVVSSIFVCCLVWCCCVC